MDTPQPDWEQSRNIIRSPEVRDLDHERLTYRFQGREFRLTDVHGKVIKEVGCNSHIDDGGFIGIC